MKTFLVRSFLFFLTAGAITVALFFFLSAYRISTDSAKDIVVESADTATSEAEKQASVASEKIKEKIPDEGVPLASLPLTESHKKALSAVNIDVETFVLTEAMITCAGENVGTERITEIIEGSAPSVLEVTKLIPCLGG